MKKNQKKPAFFKKSQKKPKKTGGPAFFKKSRTKDQPCAYLT